MQDCHPRSALVTREGLGCVEIHLVAGPTWCLDVRGGHFRVRSPGPALRTFGLSPSRCVGRCSGHLVPLFSVPSGALVAVSHGLRWQKVSEVGRFPLSPLYPLSSLSSLSTAPVGGSVLAPRGLWLVQVPPPLCSLIP